MKTTTMIALVTLALSVGIAGAQGSPSANDWRAYDSNLDGRLDNNECNQVQRNWYPNSLQAWNQFDTTGDGAANSREREMARQNWESSHGRGRNPNPSRSNNNGGNAWNQADWTIRNGPPCILATV